VSAAGYLLGTQLASCDFGAFLTSIMAYLMDNTQKNPGDAVITTSLGSKRDYNRILSSACCSGPFYHAP
jgi:hypothetical protein